MQKKTMSIAHAEKILTAVEKAHDKAYREHCELIGASVAGLSGRPGGISSLHDYAERIKELGEATLVLHKKIDDLKDDQQSAVETIYEITGKLGITIEVQR
jgi:hypothetical protein